MADPIERVRKLRAVAEQATFPGEAEAAKSRADALMAKHGLTEAQVAPPAPRPPQAGIPWGAGRPIRFSDFTYTTNTNARQGGPPNVVIDLEEFMKGFTEAQTMGGFVPQQIWINGVRVR